MKRFATILLAGTVSVLVFAMQAPELVDRWLWLPFVLAMSLRLPHGGTKRVAPVTEAPVSPSEAGPSSSPR